MALRRNWGHFGTVFDRAGWISEIEGGGEPALEPGIRLLIDEIVARRAADFAVETAKPEHGRHERRSIWASSELNGYLNFPGIGQVFAVRRETME